MTTTLACPNETELLVLAMGDSPRSKSRRMWRNAQVAGRGSIGCGQRWWRCENHENGTTPASTERDPAPAHASERQVPHRGEAESPGLSVSLLGRI